MERSSVPTTLEVSNHKPTLTEKPSFASQLVHKMLRYFADKLAPYRTTVELHFPKPVTLPDRSHHDSLIAKIGYTIDDLKPESMTDRELVAWVARYLSSVAEPISGNRVSDKFKIEFLLKTMIESPIKSKFPRNLETTVFNLLRTISHFNELSPEIVSLRFNLKKLARKAKFESCARFLSAKSKKSRSA